MQPFPRRLLNLSYAGQDAPEYLCKSYRYDRALNITLRQDTDGNGTITFNGTIPCYPWPYGYGADCFVAEFAGLWKYISDWQGVFRHFDRDQSGSIDARELADALTSFGYRLPSHIIRLIERKYGKSVRKNELYAEKINKLVVIFYSLTAQLWFPSWNYFRQICPCVCSREDAHWVFRKVSCLLMRLFMTCSDDTFYQDGCRPGWVYSNRLPYIHAGNLPIHRLQTDFENSRQCRLFWVLLESAFQYLYAANAHNIFHPSMIPAICLVY